VASHDLVHFGPVRRATLGRIDHLGRLAEELRAYCGWSDHAEHICVGNPRDYWLRAECTALAPVLRRMIGRRRSRSTLRPNRKWFPRNGRGYARAPPGASRLGQKPQRPRRYRPELSPVSRKRTVRGPRRMVSSEGFTVRLTACCAIWPPCGKLCLLLNSKLCSLTCQCPRRKKIHL
jgi:hypothetical protein